MKRSVLWWAEHAAFAVLGLLAVAGSAAAFVQSYRGLYEWAHRHGLSGFWAGSWPLQVDVFIAAGELMLFVVIVRRWPWPRLVAASAIAVVGLAVSVAGNVGHVAHADPVTRATAAVPPLAAALALAVGLAVLKWALADVPAALPGKQPQQVQAKPHKPRGVARLKTELAVGQPKAQKVQRIIREEVDAAMLAAGNGHAGG